MPRLSVDIDLTFLPILSRDETFAEISAAIGRIKKQIESSLAGSKVRALQVARAKSPTSFTVDSQKAQIKVEVNFVLRGSVYPTVKAELCQKAQDEFNVYVKITGLSKADLYEGKICAALDRQHPRAFFDVMMLPNNEGISDKTRKAFVANLASHSRPMNELLSPNWRDISVIFKKEFIVMTTEPVKLPTRYLITALSFGL